MLKLDIWDCFNVYDDIVLMFKKSVEVCCADVVAVRRLLQLAQYH